MPSVVVGAKRITGTRVTRQPSNQRNYKQSEEAREPQELRNQNNYMNLSKDWEIHTRGSSLHCLSPR